MSIVLACGQMYSEPRRCRVLVDGKSVNDDKMVELVVMPSGAGGGAAQNVCVLLTAAEALKLGKEIVDRAREQGAS